MMPTPVILLKEGTDSFQGIPQLVSNISACQVVAEAVRTALGHFSLLRDGDREFSKKSSVRARRQAPSLPSSACLRRSLTIPQ
uniref:Uncharacterized protein n=1 Tax=Mus spicilegus TaxID=10103 RepID=A0A8C6G7M7_MUSSI